MTRELTSSVSFSVCAQAGGGAYVVRIERNYRFIVGFNSGLIVLGVAGIIQSTLSALLHNMSTLGISLRSMTNLLDNGYSDELPLAHRK